LSVGYLGPNTFDYLVRLVRSDLDEFVIQIATLGGY
jgi:hypothetical protein